MSLASKNMIPVPKQVRVSKKTVKKQSNKSIKQLFDIK